MILSAKRYVCVGDRCNSCKQVRVVYGDFISFKEVLTLNFLHLVRKKTQYSLPVIEGNFCRAIQYCAFAA
jgi:hypothetical protein